MSTFENGWICRECWSANREFDGRCYRCHAARPDGSGVLTIDQVGATESEVVAQTVATAPEAVEHPAGDGQSAARPLGSYCLRCGHKLLDRAAYCTQCGMATGTQEATQAPDKVKAKSSSVRSTRRGQQARDSRQFFEQMRSAFSSFQARHELRWEAVMSTAAVLSTIAWLYADSLPSPLNSWSHLLVSAIGAVLIAEYAVRLLFAGPRSAFVRGHLLELAALAPPLRALRLARLTWLIWIRPLVREMPHPWARLRPTVSAGRPWALVAWVILLVAVTALTWAYAAADGVAGREPVFAVLALLLSAFGGLTAHLVSAAWAISRLRTEDVPRNLRILQELRQADLIDSAEFAGRRAKLLAALTPPDAGIDARPRSSPEKGDRAASHTPA